MFTIQLTDRQKDVIIKALGEYYKLRLGNFFELADDVASMFQSYETPTNGDDDDLSRRANAVDFLNRRSYAVEVFKTAYKIATNDGYSKGYHISGYTQDSEVAYDMYCELKGEKSPRKSGEPSVNIKSE